MKPTMPPTTAEAVFGRVFDRGDEQSLVDWATALLLNGSESKAVLALASLPAPYNSFEVFGLRDRILDEFGLLGIEKGEASIRYAREIAGHFVCTGDLDLIRIYGTLGALYVETDYPSELADFYYFKCAVADLRDWGVQRYVDGVTQENIEPLMWKLLRRFAAGDDERT